MTVYIHEHFYDEDNNIHENLASIIQTTFYPLDALCRELHERSNEPNDTAWVMEVLLQRAADMQWNIIKFIEAKIGVIEVIHGPGNIYRTSLYLTGLKLNKERVEWGKRKRGKGFLPQAPHFQT